MYKVSVLGSASTECFDGTGRRQPIFFTLTSLGATEWVLLVVNIGRGKWHNEDPSTTSERGVLSSKCWASQLWSH